MESLDTAQKGLVGGGMSSNFFKGPILESHVLVMFLYFLLKALEMIIFKF